MTCGSLVAPFAQISELYSKNKDVNNLISGLAVAGKFFPYSGAADFPTFLESRQELYGLRKDRYPIYFGKQIQNKSMYKQSSLLSTTGYIKSVLIATVTPGLSPPNIISVEEAARLSSHRAFITSRAFSTYSGSYPAALK